jgi:hypothetical protein
VCCSRLIWDQRSVAPSRVHAARTSEVAVQSPSSCASSRDASGSQIAAGIENNSHHSPLSPIAKRSERVEPCIRVTGTRARRSRRMPARYPDAMPCDEMREVARESAATYAVCAGLL